MFYDTSHFPFVKILEDNWKLFLSEFNSVQEKSFPYSEYDLYDGEWDVLHFMFFAENNLKTKKSCPKSWDIIKKIPGIYNASYSILRYSTDIKPHTGFSDKLLRCHLGLKIPTSCALIVEDESQTWEEGKCLIFDDTKIHSAYNHSVEDRVILLLDIEKSKYESSLQF
jgi:aspartyl/asparaginyl beta-hydroxylase (cupin superfamily)